MTDRDALIEDLFMLTGILIVTALAVFTVASLALASFGAWS